MKALVKNSASYFGILFLAAIFLSNFGCAMSKPEPDPLAGFHRADEANMDKNRAIVDDYGDYLKKLSPKEKQYVGPILYFENGTGQHAVRIETDIGGKDCWYHVLFYDKDNKRIKVIKYFYGRYIS